MQSHREYLREAGIIKEGARGRLPAEGIVLLTKAIMAGAKFTDWDIDGPIKIKKAPREQKKTNTLSAAKPTSINKIREEDAFKITEANGTVTMIDVCSQSHAVSRCSCANPRPSSFLLSDSVTVEMVSRTV